MTQAAAVQIGADYNVEALRDSLPAYAKDIKLNLGVVLTPEGAPDLTQSQIFGIALASAYATRDPRVIAAIAADASPVLSAAEAEAAKAAAVIMAMNNVYYRFAHSIHDEELKTLAPKLRMNVMASHGINHADFELCSLAVSAINGCGMCMEAHTQTVTAKHGVSRLGVQSAVRIAAVVNAAAQALV